MGFFGTIKTDDGRVKDRPGRSTVDGRACNRCKNFVKCKRKDAIAYATCENYDERA